MDKLSIPKFETKKELFAFLVENEHSLVAQKCAAVKFADGFASNLTVINKSIVVGKSAADTATDEVKVKAVINTTNIMDSHGDVHIKGLWNKSLKENKRIMMLQEHKSNQFDKIIASGEDLKASVKDYTWKELGYDVEGSTEALVFDATVKQSRNPFMFEQYSKGYVDNHSVGMRYVKLRLAVNDDDFISAKEVWKQHINEIANKEEAEAEGYFWAIYEAKVIEGSAVVNGSNNVTPTLSVKTQGNVESDQMKAIKKFLET
jgi:hypothetical protein